MNIFTRLEQEVPETITTVALKVATLANSIGAISTFGQIAQVVAVHQPLLNVIFGEQKGALVTLACLAVGQMAANIAAHGVAIGTTASVPVVVNVAPITPVETVVPSDTPVVAPQSGSSSVVRVLETTAVQPEGTTTPLSLSQETPT